ncbi:MAG: 4-alpha-glucanotransferase [Candidatus Gastranaerophilales bacterium]|nr:4-alpha-glucanotransferase [Candidatus Gastranaerophilales bacterium]MCM1072991.1 4-alpha-glucanotransferase [Bacteroides sp.]
MSCLTFLKHDTNVVNEALKVLGKENLALIVHGSSFPARDGEDTGFGTFNSESGHALIDYASKIFNAIQLGPAGKTKCTDSSPYCGTIFSGNPLFIDLKQLTQKEWGEILSLDTYKRVVRENPRQNQARTSYSYICNAQNEALKEAWKNFKDSKLLKKEFEKFKKENSYWLDNDSLYEALSIENGSDFWYGWKNETDKNLMNPKNDEEKQVYAARISEIKEKYADEIEFYSFCQFVLETQNEETKKFALKKGIKMIADRQVAFSDRDAWAYQSLFLDGWFLGCPPDYFSKDGQAWGFPVMDPDKMFNADGSLGEGGILMKNLYKKMFKENPGGVRIDHIVGLIDPWVYKAGKKPLPSQGAGRLYSSPEHSELSRYAIPSCDDLDFTLENDKEKRVKSLNDEQIKLYGRLIEKVVIAAAKECGLDKNAIVCEDLGTLTNPVDAVMKKYELQGMRLTQFVVPEKPEHPYRCKNIGENVWNMVGTHDNNPIEMWAESMINTHEGYLHAKNLVEDLFAEADNKDDIIVRLTQDKDYLTFVKLTEIFASKAKNVQIFFTDFFKIKETYNTPGTSGDQNWSLRLPNNFEELCPIDLNAILKAAIIARGKEFATKHAILIEKLG